MRTESDNSHWNHVIPIILSFKTWIIQIKSLEI